MHARLQGFPGCWEFSPTARIPPRQIGNAVPPVIGQASGLRHPG
ncbi:DNA cytosine methyltransferase [Rhizobium gallicum]|nr:DNA cytosine methyltransferase [Rhizobium gallicum]ULJ72572.1 DNA cytosine methyltransferase [Rhizobium gallicum]